MFIRRVHDNVNSVVYNKFTGAGKKKNLSNSCDGSWQTLKVGSLNCMICLNTLVYVGTLTI